MADSHTENRRLSASNEAMADKPIRFEILFSDDVTMVIEVQRAILVGASDIFEEMLSGKQYITHVHIVM